MAKKQMPKEILVYVADVLEDGTPVYAVATDVEEIPEDVNGQRIGVYTLNTSPTFVVHRSIT